MTQLHPAVVQANKELHPIGTRVQLIYMRDAQRPPIGTVGTVTGVDDLGTILVKWDNGSSLGIIAGLDRWSIVSKGQGYVNSN